MNTSGKGDKAYAKRLGSRIFSEANDLKRTPDALAAELGWNIEDVQRIIDGEADIESSKALLMQMTEVYPVSLSALWLDPDDTDDGVVIMSAAESAKTGRVFDRKDRNGNLSPYYEYRDTAMSRLAPYRPEWILELRHVGDSDPYNPDVAFNHGHLMHQLTFFIGEVNFYWISDGKRHCREMNTGDSALITPFVPHSFTSRSPDINQRGLIVAVTYGGPVRQAAASLSHLTFEQMDAAAGDMRDEASTFRARIERYRNNESLSVSGLAKRLEESGIPAMRAAGLSEADVLPNAEELTLLGAALAIKPGDLWYVPMTEEDEVAITHLADSEHRPFPDTNAPFCELSELARTPHQPGQRGFNVRLMGGVLDTSRTGFQHQLHEYLYNHGAEAIELLWGNGRRAVLGPGDSAYVRPMVEHWFEGPAGACIAMSRISGELVDDVFDEFATFATDGRSRALAETKRWF
ncbi:MAG: hypothetical protein CL573_05460 [Alphaproteobacteria bacterium]|nr:hypothetical protein [Alphaproteobacteria bacterium]